MVLILDADPKTGLSRITEGRLEQLNYFETLEYQVRVREIFLEMKDEDNVRIVNANRDVDFVQKDIRELVNEFLDSSLR
jgi:thymidylate kinase